MAGRSTVKVTRGALDYSRLAAYYDDYCRFDGDVEFFRELAAGVAGEILELMAGTGRISLPLLEDGARLTCVDGSLAMLAVLVAKLGPGRRRCRTVCADVRRLPLGERYPLVILPFHGLGELLTARDRRDLFREVGARLRVGGRFVCTAHNPAVRLRSVDDTWRVVGELTRRRGNTVRLEVRERYDEERGLVVGRQRIRVENTAGASSEMTVDLSFALVELDELVALAERVGLRLLKSYGDYDRGAYDPLASPAIISIFGA